MTSDTDNLIAIQGNQNSVRKSELSKEYSLLELMSDVTEENKHERIDFGKPVGREIL